MHLAVKKDVVAKFCRKVCLNYIARRNRIRDPRGRRRKVLKMMLIPWPGSGLLGTIWVIYDFLLVLSALC